jgi:predicted metal-dependent hydrolase
VTLRNQKTRWGSCSAGNNLSLNLKLALLDDELLDLVLVHELLHTEIKNHGPEFKQKMAQLIPDAARLDRRLKEFSGLLRTPPVGG